MMSASYIKVGLPFCFLLLGMSLPAMGIDEDPRELNKAAIEKFKADINKRPIIANTLSKDKQIKEFLKPKIKPSKELTSDEGDIQAETASQTPSQAGVQEGTVSETPPSEVQAGISPETPLPAEAHEGNSAKTPSLPETHGALSSEEAKKEEKNTAKEALEKQSPKLTYKRKTIVFYKKECAGARCVRVPVLTNLKSVIYEHNQGRYSSSSGFLGVRSPASSKTLKNTESLRQEREP